MDPTVPITIALAAGLFLVLGAVLDDRRARMRRREQAMGLDIETVVPLLHSINDDRCIGCEACIDVCPTQVLDLVDHIVKVVRFSDCVQCEQCANACPTAWFSATPPCSAVSDTSTSLKVPLIAPAFSSATAAPP